MIMRFPRQMMKDGDVSGCCLPESIAVGCASYARASAKAGVDRARDHAAARDAAKDPAAAGREGQGDREWVR